MTWYAVRRSADISANRQTSTYVAAIMVEDFAPWISTTTRLSSVPLQMLIFVYKRAAGACATVPSIIGDRPNRACIGVDINSLVSERVVAQTSVALVSGTTNQYYITLSWIPVTDQYGPQVFCAAAIDQRQLTGSQYCFTFVVGYRSPELNTPITVQGSASPLGTVFSNHSTFSITATAGVNRPNRNGTYIKIYLLSNNTLVWQVDCGWSPLVIYTGTTVIFTVPNPSWTEGETYYILFDSGAVSGNVFCGPESAPIISNAYWRFNIWQTSRSSTTTTTTTPPTTHTLTTRPLSTTTPQPNLTTTGIVITTTTVITTTVTTVTTSTTTTSTTATTTPTTTTIDDSVSIITAKDFEEACRVPVAVTNAGLYAVLLPIQAAGMFAFISHFAQIYNPNQIQANARQQRRVRRMGY
ncbi:unnamed protein product [Rotaria sordida]|uniref:Uncharacterized protein n=2 Tax=Rotaria sordida TaxID=392033 RepID=A0A819C922_9BILA|nr:unnamed protein product [Rotaria sordida]